MRIMLTATTFDHTNKDGHLGRFMEIIVDAYRGTPVLLHVNHGGTTYGHACTMTAYHPPKGNRPAEVQITEHGMDCTVACRDITAVTALPDPTATHRDNITATDPAHAAVSTYRQVANGYRRAWHSAYDALETLAAAATTEDEAGQERALVDYNDACQQQPGLNAVLRDMKMIAMKGELGRLTSLRPRLEPAPA